MQVTFNGIQLRHVIYHKIHGTRETFHFVDHSQQIEDAMRIGAPALIYLSTTPIEGIIVHYMGDQDRGYEVTVETGRAKRVLMANSPLGTRFRETESAL